METKRVHRVQQGKVIAGVCTGLAQYLNVDVVWVRVAFAVAGVMSAGLAFWGYLFLWAMMPASADAQPLFMEVIEKVKGFFSGPAQGQPRPEQPGA